MWTDSCEEERGEEGRRRKEGREERRRGREGGEEERKGGRRGGEGGEEWKDGATSADSLSLHLFGIPGRTMKHSGSY